MDNNETTSKKMMCQKPGCTAIATWLLLSGDDAYCDEHVPRGCSCQISIDDGTPNRDDKGRLLPCVEYIFDEEGFDANTHCENALLNNTVIDEFKNSPITIEFHVPAFGGFLCSRTRDFAFLQRNTLRKLIKSLTVYKDENGDEAGLDIRTGNQCRSYDVIMRVIGNPFVIRKALDL